MPPQQPPESVGSNVLQKYPQHEIKCAPQCYNFQRNNFLKTEN